MKSNKYSIFIFFVLICSTHCAYKIWDKEEFYNEQKSDKKDWIFIIMSLMI
jgi:hypothetical protein